ncbi:hypothetical protein B0H10DRAFT_1961882 [Mycena sp. CBHHK59/15]|nr:hypothetical protein B0H10DRAFT_1961882 [Mycena sp. CBHHK59/15]
MFDSSRRRTESAILSKNLTMRLGHFNTVEFLITACMRDVDPYGFNAAREEGTNRRQSAALMYIAKISETKFYWWKRGAPEPKHPTIYLSKGLSSEAPPTLENEHQSRQRRRSAKATSKTRDAKKPGGGGNTRAGLRASNNSVEK